MDLIARHKEWPDFRGNPIRFVHTSVFYALKRRQEYSGSYEQFLADVLLCESTDDDEDIVPTEPASTAG